VSIFVNCRLFVQRASSTPHSFVLWQLHCLNSFYVTKAILYTLAKESEYLVSALADLQYYFLAANWSHDNNRTVKICILAAF